MRLTEKLNDKVRDLLIYHPKTRDDDMHLLALIWNREGVYEDTLHFFTKLSAGKLPNPETVRRTRQLLQQENPDLRGEKYRSRHKHVKTFKKDVKRIAKYSNPQMEMM